MKWASIILLWLVFSPAFAQQHFEIQGEYAKGFILKHSSSISHLTLSHPSTLFISAYKLSDGENEWEQRYKYPKIGATFLYLDYYNPILGKSVGLIPNYSFHLGDPLNNFKGYLKVGIGPAYHTNPYDKTENNKNNVVSTHFSYGIIFQSGFNILLANRTSLISGISFTHFSNGSFKKPNTGINVISANIGLSYGLNSTAIEYAADDKISSPANSSWRPELMLSGGFAETLKIRTGTYPFFNLQLLLSKKLNYKSIIGFGTEYFHSYSLREEIKNDVWLKEGEDPDFRRFAVVVSHDLVISKFSVRKQLGYYFYDPYEAFQPFYFRLGLKYNLTEQLFLGLAVKSHYFKAEATEWSIGYRL